MKKELKQLSLSIEKLLLLTLESKITWEYDKDNICNPLIWYTFYLQQKIVITQCLINFKRTAIMWMENVDKEKKFLPYLPEVDNLLINIERLFLPTSIHDIKKFNTLLENDITPQSINRPDKNIQIYKLWIEENVIGTGRLKCEVYSKKMNNFFPELILKSGFYIDQYWGRQKHYWLVTKDKVIIDPTAQQFPTKGKGSYIEIKKGQTAFNSCKNCLVLCHEDEEFCSKKCKETFEQNKILYYNLFK